MVFGSKIWKGNLSSLTSKTRIKQIGGSNLKKDFNGGFSYIISSWLIKKGQKLTVMTLYIMTFCPTSSNIYIYIYVFLVVAFYSISSALQCWYVLVKLANKIMLAKMPAAC